MADYNFDSVAVKFVNRIYVSNKDIILKEIVWCELLDYIARLNKSSLRVLDAGDVFGYFSQKLATAVHPVVFHVNS